MFLVVVWSTWPATSSNSITFAAILADGSVVTWGHELSGGDSSTVQDQLKNVQNVQASSGAFAALLADGAVVTWGNPAGGGDSSRVQDQLRHVRQVQASEDSFAALLDGGFVVTWGHPDYGGDSSKVQDQLRDVQQIQATASAFAVILENGSVVSWGHPEYGGDSSAVQSQLRKVRHLQASAGAFAAQPEAVLRSDGALHAKHLRPIAIQCILWRIIASSWTCRSDTRQWVQRWAHPSAQGGVAGRSVGQAIVLVSLDYSKCFDHVDPKIGIRCLVHLGCPRQIAGPLSAIWLNQRRWLTYNGECLPEAQQVSSSLPQGDSLSPLTLIAIVSGLSAHIVHDEPEPHVLTTFLDDRNFIASSPAQAGRLFHKWKLLSDEVGLSENSNKAKVLTRKQKWQQDLIDEGFSADQIVPSTRVLGVDATARLGAAIKPTHDLRVRQAQQRADRIALLPVTSQHKRGLLASMVVPKAVWGTWTRRPPASKLDTKIKRCSGCHQSASVDLWVLLTGHGLSVEFCSGFQAFSYLAKQIHRRPRQWQPRPRRGTWVHRVQRWLASLGWTSVAPWMWNHPRQNWNLNLQNPITERDAHEIRESWRWQRFQSFLNSSRRDVQGVVVDARRISLARKLFRQQNVHGCGVMMGGVISDARFDKIRSVNLGGCQWCSEETVPTWHHLAWECPELAATRCRLPQDPLQRVLGWPTGADKAYDEAVMVHLSTVRQRILDRRYRHM